MNIKKVNAGVWIKASEELPKDEKVYPVLINDILMDVSHYKYNSWMVDSTQYIVTHWLKPVEGYVLTEDELLEIKVENYQRGYTKGINDAGHPYS